MESATDNCPLQLLPSGPTTRVRVTVSIDDEARTWLAVHGYDPQMGARPMTRLIQENIKKPLAEELLFGKLAEGGHIRITVKDDELAFDLKAKNELVTQQ